MPTLSNLKQSIIPGGVWEEGLAVLHEIEGALRIGLAGDHSRVITERGKPALSDVEWRKEDLLKVLRTRNLNICDTVVGAPTLEDVFTSLAR